MEKLFISHSSKDKQFAYELHVSLCSLGLQTFYDDRDIKIGDSIPDKIYAGIDSATHLIYIVSSNSINSVWVREEVSIAKMKEKADSGFKIIPILIDDISLPTSLMHIKIFDFRKWKSVPDYRKSFLHLVRELGFTPRSLEKEDLVWYSKNKNPILRFKRDLDFHFGNIYGGLVAHQASRDQIRPPVFYSSVRSAVYDPGLQSALREFSNLLSPTAPINSKFVKLRACIMDLLSFCDNIAMPRVNCEEYDNAKNLLQKIENVKSILDGFSIEIESALLSPFHLEGDS